MVDISGDAKWSPVRVLEDNELAQGGINGNMNEQAKALVERTELLKNVQNDLQNSKADKVYVDQLVVNATQGQVNFKSQVELLAYVPSSPNYTAKALDTKKVWIWDGSKWNDTGLSELDQSIQYTDLITLLNSKNVLTQNAAEFHNTDYELNFLPIVVADNIVLLALNANGKVLNPEPDLAMKKEIINHTDDLTLKANTATLDLSSAEFHNGSEESIIPIVVSNNQVIVAINKNGQLVNTVKESVNYEFHNDETAPTNEFSEVDENGFILPAGNNNEFDTSTFPNSEKDLEKGNVYVSNDTLKLAKDYTSDFYTASVTSAVFSTYAAIYEIIDGWMSQHPDYIFKTLIGNDAWNNPIYKYEFLSPRFVDDGAATTITDQRTRPPRILLNSGTHGVEREAVVSSVMFMHDVVNNWQKSDELAKFRWATDIIFVPIVNPSGFNANTRENANNVDINRDGVAKTQIETNLFLSVLDGYTDVDFCIDHHNSYDLTMSKRPFWVAVEDAEAFVMCRELAYEMSCYIKKEFNLYVSANTPSSKISSHISTSLTKANQTKHGVTAILLETPRQGATSIISLKNRRIHNQYALFKTMSKVRDFILNKQAKDVTA
ncbi:DUF2817 domain-containing protein [Acinetobacter soli]|uniref:DUF2817 domain-containing protein n=1 Tax=Acinetobacter soli TaxID=487316 RepID=UPI002FEF9D20